MIDQPVFVFSSGASAAAAVGRELVVAFSAGEETGAGGGGDDEDVLVGLFSLLSEGEWRKEGERGRDSEVRETYIKEIPDGGPNRIIR